MIELGKIVSSEKTTIYQKENGELKTRRKIVYENGKTVYLLRTKILKEYGTFVYKGELG